MKRKPKNTEAKCGEGQCGGDGKSVSLDIAQNKFALPSANICAGSALPGKLDKAFKE